MTKSLLRVFTAGSVDDGKSTLIGRLLYDTKSIFEDQYEAIKTSSELRGEQNVNLALLTDGLRAEREQGITIDVAYRYFSTPVRKFIIADTPGHIQYTRNMVTGSSNADLAIIMVDARNGIIEQTKRHSLIISLLGIKHIIVCVNKMDLVGFKKEVFENISRDFELFSYKLNLADVQYIPIVALSGDNIVQKSERMPWYNGYSLLSMLEDIQDSDQEDLVEGRFPVQYLINTKSEDGADYKGYAGKVAGGSFKKGDKVKVLPSGINSKIKDIKIYQGSIEEVSSGASVTLLLEDNVDVSRGDMLVSEYIEPRIESNIDIMVCWLNEQKLTVGNKYILKHTTKDTYCLVTEIKYKINISTLDHTAGDKEIALNEIGRISIKTSAPLFFDSYSKNRNTGSLILIDETSNETVGAGIIV